MSSSNAPVAPPPPDEGSERVVEVNVADPSPTVRVVTFDVENSVDVVWLTQTVWPLLIVPGAFVKTPLQPMEYLPFELLILAAVSIPVMVIVFEVADLSVLRPV